MRSTGGSVAGGYIPYSATKRNKIERCHRHAATEERINIMKNFNETVDGIVGVDRVIDETVKAHKQGLMMVGVDDNGVEVTQKAFRGNVDLSKYDDRVDPDISCLSISTPGRNYIKPMPCNKTNEEIDRQHRYNVMMGKTGINGMGYIFS